MATETTRITHNQMAGGGFRWAGEVGQGPRGFLLPLPHQVCLLPWLPVYSETRSWGAGDRVEASDLTLQGDFPEDFSFPILVTVRTCTCTRRTEEVTPPGAEGSLEQGLCESRDQTTLGNWLHTLLPDSVCMTNL
jgi:hypothetical protein